MKDIILHVKGLVKLYNQKSTPSRHTRGGFTLNIPFLEFEEGKIYSFLGPNGAGKTTFFNLLSLVERSDRGQIFYRGKIVGPSSLDYRRRIGLVMQDPFLFHTSVYNNVAYGLKVRSHRRNEIQEKVARALELVGLLGFSDRTAYELSGGEAQRVALARALVLEPEILLLDEPTANIDRRNREIIEETIRRINREGTTIFFTTHNLSQAYSLADKVVTLLDGKLLETTPDNLFSGIVKESGGLREFSLSSEVKIILATEKIGRAHISIAPEDILLSRKPLASSARNSFLGRITKIVAEGQKVRLYIDTGVEFVAVITRESFQEMGLNISSQVYLTFKTSAVKVY
jgi:tungstate transport system ATP-binding protein